MTLGQREEDIRRAHRPNLLAAAIQKQFAALLCGGHSAFFYGECKKREYRRCLSTLGKRIKIACFSCWN